MINPHILFTSLFFIFVSCTPTKLRRTGDINPNLTQNALTDENQTDDNGQIGDSHIESGAGWSHCSSGTAVRGTFIGQLRACKNQYEANLVKIQIDSSDNGVRTCVLPTFLGSDGNSIPLRTQATCFSHQANEVKMLNLPTNNSHYSGFRLNSLMVLKESITTAYYNCLNAKTHFLQQASTNCIGISGADCIARAEANKRRLCTQFKTQFKNKKYLVYQF